MPRHNERSRKCKQCRKLFLFTTRCKRQFCGPSCASKFNGKRRGKDKYCAWCDARFVPDKDCTRQKYCGVQCSIRAAQQKSTARRIERRIEAERIRQLSQADRVRIFGLAERAPSRAKLDLQRKAMNMLRRARWMRNAEYIRLAEQALQELRNEVA